MTIFDEILKGNADVMISESVETIVAAEAAPGLCAVNPDKPLQYGEMAYLLPRGDVAIKAWVDTVAAPEQGQRGVRPAAGAVDEVRVGVRPRVGQRSGRPARRRPWYRRARCSMNAGWRDGRVASKVATVVRGARWR